MRFLTLWIEHFEGYAPEVRFSRPEFRELNQAKMIRAARADWIRRIHLGLPVSDDYRKDYTLQQVVELPRRRVRDWATVGTDNTWEVQ